MSQNVQFQGPIRNDAGENSSDASDGVDGS